MIHGREAAESALPSKQLLDIMVKNISANLLYRSEHIPGLFDGDMIIFSARRTGSGLLLEQSWRPYVSGDITEYPVDCRHDEMLNVEVLRLFGVQLDVALAE